MEEMIMKGVALLEPQLLTAVKVPVTVYVGHFVSWHFIMMFFDNLKIKFYFLSHKLFLIPFLIRKKNVECFH
jgi:hypothetical protein